MSRVAVWLIAAAPVLLASPASAQLSGVRTSGGCISVEQPTATVSATGRLTLRHMPGPPNFESVGHGDKDMPTLILVLPKPACIDDEGDFADPKVRFSTVHVWTLDRVVHRKLRSLIGRKVTVTGEGYAQNNALHYAPLVLEAKSVTRRRR